MNLLSVMDWSTLTNDRKCWDFGLITASPIVENDAGRIEVTLVELRLATASVWADLRHGKGGEERARF